MRARWPNRFRSMIKDAEIRNFRCFKSISLKGCRRINVLLGRNASGKTALLEAIFIALGGSGEIAQRLRGWRGLGNIVSNNIAADRYIWSDLFYDFDLNKRVSITLKGDKEHQRSLNITYNTESGFTPIQVGPGQPGTLLASPVKFEYREPNKQWTVRAVPLGDQYIYPGAETIPVESIFFASTVPINQAEIVDRFSTLIRTRQEEPLVRALNAEFPFIKGIEISSQFGMTGLPVDREGLSERIPLGLVSGGISKILALLVAIAVYPGGVILIDEIENGIYFERYHALWTMLYDFAEKRSASLCF